jgi:hypothetical protein
MNDMIYISHPGAMVYLVGGYKLTRDQVLQWCQPRNLNPPEFNITLVVNRWLSSQNVHTRLLACDYQRECVYLVVTDRKVDPKGTFDEFEPFQESERARNIKRVKDGLHRFRVCHCSESLRLADGAAALHLRLIVAGHHRLRHLLCHR